MNLGIDWITDNSDTAFQITLANLVLHGIDYPHIGLKNTLSGRDTYMELSHDKKIRRLWHDDEWFYSVSDIIAVLTDSKDELAYWRKLKQREPQLVTICHGLKLPAADGKLRYADCVTTRNAFRQDLTDEWKDRGIQEQKDFAILTNEISKATFGKTVGEYKKFKGLERESQNLRDHMTDWELILTMVGEKATTDITISKDSQE